MSTYVALRQAELRVAAPGAAVLRLLALTGAGRLLRTYPSVRAALRGDGPA